LLRKVGVQVKKLDEKTEGAYQEYVTSNLIVGKEKKKQPGDCKV